MNGSYPQQPLYPSQTPQRPSGRGGSCFLKGCIVVVVVLMFLGVALGGLGWYASRFVGAYFTRDQKPIHKVEDGEAKFAAAQAKLAKFNQTVAAGHPDVLILTADDLNGLVARDPRLADERNRLYLSIVNNQIVAETSFPVNEDQSARSDQKLYVNARLVLDASYASGDFTFQLARFESLDGRPLPGAVSRLRARLHQRPQPGLQPEHPRAPREQ